MTMGDLNYVEPCPSLMRHLYERAALAGGCDSPVRSGWAVGGPMFVQASARDAYAFDERGRRYVDYIMAYGPLLFGHTHPALVTGLDELARGGFVWGSGHAHGGWLAARFRAGASLLE